MFTAPTNRVRIDGGVLTDPVGGHREPGDSRDSSVQDVLGVSLEGPLAESTVAVVEVEHLGVRRPGVDDQTLRVRPGSRKLLSRTTRRRAFL